MDQTAQKRVSKACDACKRRKVRCNGQTRCQQCAHLGLRCIYSPSSKQRSQGKRGHIISEFRNQTSTLPATAPPILPAHPGQVGYPTGYSPISPTVTSNEAEASTSLLKLVKTRWNAAADPEQHLPHLLSRHSTPSHSFSTSSPIMSRECIQCILSLQPMS
jgi:hypothetical protein